jgi:hypothetical protein
MLPVDTAAAAIAVFAGVQLSSGDVQVLHLDAHAAKIPPCRIALLIGALQTVRPGTWTHGLSFEEWRSRVRATGSSAAETALAVLPTHPQGQPLRLQSSSAAVMEYKNYRTFCAAVHSSVGCYEQEGYWGGWARQLATEWLA